jgi:hypothetical protein
VKHGATVSVAEKQRSQLCGRRVSTLVIVAINVASSSTSRQSPGG